MKIFVKLIVVLICILSSFNVNAQNKNSINKVDSVKKIVLEYFNEIPDELDGCLCYFSKSKSEFIKNHYLLINDFSNIAFLKINGVLTRFELEKFDEANNVFYYINPNYKMKIQITKTDTDSTDEVDLYGVILIETENMKNETSFFGKCIC
jgi:hypothetical protein